MKTDSGFKVAALAAAVALAMGSTAVMAAAPAATQLPGQGKVLSTGTAPVATITADTNTLGIVLNSATVIDWNKGTTVSDINPNGVAGFNIGADATVNFTGNFGALNLDSTGNPSQIFGALTGQGNVFVANSNGIIVGAGASISSNVGVGLIANDLESNTGADFDGQSIAYNGTGGDVTVQPGAGISGFAVFVAGGSNVNVDLAKITTANLVVSAGLPSNVGYDVPTNSFTTSGFTVINANAAVNVTGTLPTGSTFGGGGLTSGGDITTTGTLDLGEAPFGATAGGTFTNNGTLVWGHAGSNTPGNVVNNGSITLTGTPDIGGSLTNNGQITGAGHVILANGVNNAGSIAADIIQSTGDFTNSGIVAVNTTASFPVVTTARTYPAAITVIGGNFSNAGQLTAANVSITGGNFSNDGSVAVQGLFVQNGSVVNNGAISLTGTGDVIEVASDSALSSFTSGADYSITNTGTITSANNLFLTANSDRWGDHVGGVENDSTGSVTNTGKLQVAVGTGLGLQAYNDVNLAGTLQTKAGTTVKAISATNPLDSLHIYAGDYDNLTVPEVPVLGTSGVATVATPVAFTNGAFIAGNQVKLMSDISGVDDGGEPASFVQIVAGAQSTSDYAVRVASGKTVSAQNIFVSGDKAGDNPNMILQGTLAADQMFLGNGVALSDVFSGPSGGLVVTGDTPRAYIAFTGRVKSAPYLNDANFRYNYLPITNAGTAALDLELLPMAYATNSTANGLGGVNVLVNGDVTLYNQENLQFPFRIDGTDSAVTGVTNIPNTHLVVQSTGNITAASYYWPGYVYLGTIASDANGNALPGTLGLGKITLNGDFSNVLPGSLDMGAGVHFMTQFPMVINGDVTTNANAWVNFGTELLTNAYATGTLPGDFFGGVQQGTGLVVNYGTLDPSMFHTHLPDATR